MELNNQYWLNLNYNSRRRVKAIKQSSDSFFDDYEDDTQNSSKQKSFHQSLQDLLDKDN
tara:strand:- start:1998 stop:2174 length:177 start_codon:yes stop_codon:yes gene_type:complete